MLIVISSLIRSLSPRQPFAILQCSLRAEIPLARHGFTFFLLVVAVPAAQALRLGPVTLDPQLTVESRYNSNVNQSPVNPLWDVILGTQVQASGDWPITRYNTLDFRLSAGYERYLRNPELNSDRLSTAIVPDMNIEFTIRVTDYINIVVVDRLELKRDPTDAVGVDEQGEFVFDAVQYNRLDNALSATLNWDVNSRTVAQAGLRRNDIYPLDDLFDSTRRIQYTTDFLLQRQLGTRFSGGLSGAVTHNYHRQTLLNDGRSRQAGVFLNTQISPRMNLLTRLSHIWQNFSTEGEIGDASSPRHLVGSLEFRHTPDPRLTYTLTAARSTQFGFTANTTLVDNYGVAGIWTGFRLGDVRVGYNYARGRDSGGVLAERYHRHSTSAALAMELGPNSGMRFSYRYVSKNSNREDRSFDQHVFGVSAFYRF